MLGNQLHVIEEQGLVIIILSSSYIVESLIYRQCFTVIIMNLELLKM